MTRNTLNIELSANTQTQVFEFFWLFSRFEYALKRLKFWRSNDDSSVIGVNWGKAATDRDWAALDDQVKASPRARYILDHPPKRLVVKDGALDWRATTAKQGPQAIHYTKQVRNNLFHGGKFIGGPVAGAERDRELIGAATEVLLILGRIDSELWEKVSEHA